VLTSNHRNIETSPGYYYHLWFPAEILTLNRARRLDMEARYSWQLNYYNYI